jgi:quinoprotein glucose dehydrogenase
VGGDKGCSRYSSLSQINRRNVNQLQVAWLYHTGDSGKTSTIECTPIVIGGVMFLTTASSRVVALDAGTGSIHWKYDPYEGVKITQPRVSGGVNRGVAYWSGGSPGGQRRIFLGLGDARLVSLDAKTGQPDPAFGKADGDFEGLEVSNGVTTGRRQRRRYQDIVILGFSCPGAVGRRRVTRARSTSARVVNSGASTPFHGLENSVTKPGKETVNTPVRQIIGAEPVWMRSAG